MRIRKKFIFSYLVVVAGLMAGVVQAQELAELSAVEVRAQAEDLAGIAGSGSEGVVSSQRLAAMPILRPGEALEMIPGLIVTQHAGDGKANQYFLRGFNLDHGTDFATFLGGVPVNMPSHAHGQGYTDLNFLIPELVEQIAFRKGPYFAEEGDFSSAGAAHLDYFRQLETGLAQLTRGGHGYTRMLLADSPELGGGRLLYALEGFHNDGPWQVPEDYRKLNGVLRYSRGTREDGWSVTGMVYRGQWVSTDQVAERAINAGLVNRFGSLDATTGGNTHRHALSGEWARREAGRQSRANVWLLDSGLDLWSNFTYCTKNCPSGDQFRQTERRQAGGLALAHTLFDRWGDFEVINALGLQTRVDRLSPVGIYSTYGRDTLSTVREDRVNQHSLGLWFQNETRWTEGFRSVQGLRADSYRFGVDSSLPANSGTAGDAMVTPKLSLIFGPWQQTELYFNYGHGFHSNDARGATLTVDPSTGTSVDANGSPVRQVKPLVRTRGAEVGVRSEWQPGWRSTLAVWQLETESELLFLGDAGTTKASRPSRRYGLEWTNLYTPNSWLAVDADLAWSQARFTDMAPEGNRIPGAVTTTANVGISIDHAGPWFGAVRWRYFGPRPLIEDNSVQSGASSLVNARMGYRLSSQMALALDIYNLFDSKVNDVEYWYESRLAGEAASVADRHLHPTEPFSLRLTLQYRF